MSTRVSFRDGGVLAPATTNPEEHDRNAGKTTATTQVADSPINSRPKLIDDEKSHASAAPSEKSRASSPARGKIPNSVSEKDDTPPASRQSDGSAPDDATQTSGGLSTASTRAKPRARNEISFVPAVATVAPNGILTTLNRFVRAPFGSTSRHIVNTSINLAGVYNWVNTVQYGSGTKPEAIVTPPKDARNYRRIVLPGEDHQKLAGNFVNLADEHLTEIAGLLSVPAEAPPPAGANAGSEAGLAWRGLVWVAGKLTLIAPPDPDLAGTAAMLRDKDLPAQGSAPAPHSVDGLKLAARNEKLVLAETVRQGENALYHLREAQRAIENTIVVARTGLPEEAHREFDEAMDFEARLAGEARSLSPTTRPSRLATEAIHAGRWIVAPDADEATRAAAAAVNASIEQTIESMPGARVEHELLQIRAEICKVLQETTLRTSDAQGLQASLRTALEQRDDMNTHAETCSRNIGIAKQQVFDAERKAMVAMVQHPPGFESVEPKPFALSAKLDDLRLELDDRMLGVDKRTFKEISPVWVMEIASRTLAASLRDMPAMAGQVLDRIRKESMSSLMTTDFDPLDPPPHLLFVQALLRLNGGLEVLNRLVGGAALDDSRAEALQVYMNAASHLHTDAVKSQAAGPQPAAPTWGDKVKGAASHVFGRADSAAESERPASHATTSNWCKQIMAAAREKFDNGGVIAGAKDRIAYNAGKQGSLFDRSPGSNFDKMEEYLSDLLGVNLLSGYLDTDLLHTILNATNLPTSSPSAVNRDAIDALRRSAVDVGIVGTRNGSNVVLQEAIDLVRQGADDAAPAERAWCEVATDLMARTTDGTNLAHVTFDPALLAKLTAHLPEAEAGSPDAALIKDLRSGRMHPLDALIELGEMGTRERKAKIAAFDAGFKALKKSPNDADLVERDALESRMTALQNSADAAAYAYGSHYLSSAKVTNRKDFARLLHVLLINSKLRDNVKTAGINSQSRVWGFLPALKNLSWVLPAAAGSIVSFVARMTFQSTVDEGLGTQKGQATQRFAFIATRQKTKATTGSVGFGATVNAENGKINNTEAAFGVRVIDLDAQWTYEQLSQEGVVVAIARSKATSEQDRKDTIKLIGNLPLYDEQIFPDRDGRTYTPERMLEYVLLHDRASIGTLSEYDRVTGKNTLTTSVSPISAGFDNSSEILRLSVAAVRKHQTVDLKSVEGGGTGRFEEATRTVVKSVGDSITFNAALAPTQIAAHDLGHDLPEDASYWQRLARSARANFFGATRGAEFVTDEKTRTIRTSRQYVGEAGRLVPNQSRILEQDSQLKTFLRTVEATKPLVINHGVNYPTFDEASFDRLDMSAYAHHELAEFVAAMEKDERDVGRQTSAFLSVKALKAEAAPDIDAYDTIARLRREAGDLDGAAREADATQRALALDANHDLRRTGWNRKSGMNKMLGVNNGTIAGKGSNAETIHNVGLLPE